MEELPVMAVKPTDVKVLIVRDSSTSTARELSMSNQFPSMNTLISDALGKMESDGYALLDIRYSAIRQEGGGYEHFAMIIGRKAIKESSGSLA
jgi:hypothetical protein